MDIPHKKNASSPITGRSSRKPKAAGASTPAIPPVSPESTGDGEDIAISDEIFEKPVISLPARAASEAKTVTDSNEPSSPPAPKETPERVSRKKNLEHRAPAEPFQFKRLIRPQTVIASHAAADTARAESPAPLESVDHTSMQFGKIHPQSTPGYRPNRLFRVLDSIYTHSPLRWLDFLERGGVRFVAGTLIFLIVGGFVAWRYYDSLSVRDAGIGGTKTEVVASPEERIERGKKAVQEFMAAQTPEARLPYVIDPERAASRMKQFYEEMKGEDPKVTSWEVGTPVAGKQGAWLPFIFQDSAGRKVTVVIEENDHGYRVDWENFVAFGDMLWPEFCSTRPAGSKAMRVRLREVDEYGGKYPKDRYQAYEIEHRSGAPRLLGYAERAGRTGQALAEMLKGGNPWRTAQLYLQFGDSAGGENQVLIADIVRSRWQDEATAWTAP